LHQTRHGPPLGGYAVEVNHFVPILGTFSIVPIIGTMQKSISSPKYVCVIDWLKKARVDQGISMRELAVRLGQPHSFVQKIESLERRLDVYEYSVYCEALGLDPVDGIELIKRR